MKWLYRGISKLFIRVVFTFYIFLTNGPGKSRSNLCIKKKCKNGILFCILNHYIIIIRTQGSDCCEWRTDIHTVEAERMGKVGWMGVRMVWRQDATRPPPRQQVTWSSDTTTADQAVNKKNTHMTVIYNVHILTNTCIVLVKLSLAGYIGYNL